MLKPVLEDRSILKIGQNLKYDIGIFARYAITLAPIDDTMLLSYALDGARFNGMDELTEATARATPASRFTELAGTGKAQKTFDQIDIAAATRYAAEDADITLRLWHVLKPRLVPENATTLYETLERPLAPVLARMEARGISVDRAILRNSYPWRKIRLFSSSPADPARLILARCMWLACKRGSSGRGGLMYAGEPGGVPARRSATKGTGTGVPCGPG